MYYLVTEHDMDIEDYAGKVSKYKSDNKAE